MSDVSLGDYMRVRRYMERHGVGTAGARWGGVSASSSAPHIQMGLTEIEKRRHAMVGGLLARANLGPHEFGNPYCGMPLPDLARECAERDGANVDGMRIPQIVAAALQTSAGDLPNVLQDAANLALLKGWDASPETYQYWTSPGEVRDFKPGARVGSATLISFDRIPQSGEYKEQALDDRGETVQVYTYGKMIAITRAAIINDDLGAFMKQALSLGRAARRKIGDLAYGVLTANAAMSDGTALFHANHGNLAGGGALSSSLINTLRVLMAAQKDNAGTRLGIRLAYLLVPSGSEGIAKGYRDSVRLISDNAAPAELNPVFNTFEVISDGRLDADSAVVCYGVADPVHFDTLEISYLNGVTGPMIEGRTPFTSDGFQLKARIDVGVKALDYRTLCKMPGV